MVINELVSILGFKVEGEGAVRRYEAALQGVATKAAAVGAAIIKVTAIAATAAVGGAGFLARGVMQTSAQFEKLQATLETIEGSAGKAREAMDWVANFAKTTPYEVQEVTDAFVKLRAYGMDPMSGLLGTIGDTASAMGKSLNQAVEAFADAAQGEFERLKEFGIRAEQAGKQVTFTWQENGKNLTKTVKKNGKDITKFLQDTFGKRFGGAMVRQSKTWAGMMSNLSDSWTDFKRKIGDGGFFDAMKNRLADALDTVGRWDREGKLRAVASSISSAFTWVADKVGFAVSRIVRHVEFLYSHFDKLKGPLLAFGATVAVVIARAMPLVTVLLALGTAVEDFLTYLQGGESVIGAFIDALGNWVAANEGIKSALDAIKTAFAGGNWFELGQQAGRLLIEGIKALGGALFGWLSSDIAAGDWAGTGQEVAKAIFNGLKALVGFVAGLGFELVAALVAAFVGVGAKIIATIAAGIVSFAELGRKWGADLINGMIEGIKSGVAEIQAAIRSILPEGLQLGLGMDVKPRLSPGEQKQFDGLPTLDAPPEKRSDAGALMRNFAANMAKTSASSAAGRVAADITNNNTDSRSYSPQISAPINIQVSQATQAPGVVASAVQAAVTKGTAAGLAPARLQASPATA